MPLLVAAGFTLAVFTLQADQTSRVMPPDSKPYGAAYNEWGADWWDWALNIPAGTNPLLDATGENAAASQSGPVWFLAGNFGGTSVRSIAVPTGKALLIPVLNTVYIGFPCDERNLPGCEFDQALEAANDIPSLLSFITPAMDGVTIACEIDGQPVRTLSAYRTQSSAIYSLTLPEDNILGLPSGPYHPCVDTGYYVMLAPLSAGDHTIHFSGANGDNSFSLDVTYHIIVK